jgi:hypothetical protein
LAAPILEKLRAAKIDFDSLPPSGRRESDVGVLARAEQHDRALLTLDGDFWNDRKHPVHRLRTGIIYVAEPPDQYDRILRALGLVYGCFAKSYPLDWLDQMKAKARVGEFELKMRNWENKIVRYQLRLSGGHLMVREL